MAKKQAPAPLVLNDELARAVIEISTKQAEAATESIRQQRDQFLAMGWTEAMYEDLLKVAEDNLREMREKAPKF